MLNLISNLFNKRQFSNENAVILLICIAIATVFWFLSVLSKPYQSSIVLEVRYLNLPKDSVLKQPLPDRFQLDVKAPGWDLVAKQLNISVNTVVLDIKPFKAAGFMATNSQVNIFANQLPAKYQLLRVHPDTLFFEFDIQSERKVPIRPELIISFDQLHDLDGEPSCNPDSVLLKGPLSVIEVFQYWSTEPLTIKEPSETIVQTVNLAKPKSGNIVLSVTKTELTIQVDQITEGSLVIPVQVIFPEGIEYSIVHFPKTILVKYQVLLNKYDRITPELFEVVSDLSKIDVLNNKTAPIIIKKAPSAVKHVSVDPNMIEYLIYEK